MKRTFAKQSLMSLVAGFFLFGMLLTANRSEAQTNWMQPAEAQQVLISQLNNLRNDIANNPPGSGAHTNALIHAYYYKGIFVRLDEGMTTEASVMDALTIFPETLTSPNSKGFSRANAAPDVPFALGKAAKGNLYNEAEALLKQ